MHKGKTISGFEYEISPDLFNDYELVEQLSELEENAFLLTKVIVKVLGKEQAQKLKEHLRDENGIVPTDKMMAEIEEIFTIGGEELKNS